MVSAKALLKISLVFMACASGTAAYSSITCSDIHKLYEEGKNLVNIKRLYDGLIQFNQISQNEHQLGYKYFNFEFSQNVSHNVNEEYLRAKILTQTASLFYDKYMDEIDGSEIPLVFQNFSNCFIEPMFVPSNVNYFSNEKYRSINGYGNNLKYKKRGESFTSYNRLVRSHYDDHVYSIRKSMRGYELPSPRNIVRKIFLNEMRTNLEPLKNRSKIPNMLFIMIGQLIKHDTGSRQITQSVGSNSGIRCCSRQNKYQLSPNLMHSSCIPITISRSDGWYSPRNIRCIDFIRSNIISNNPYKLQIGDQMNQVTSFLDLSVIYGSNGEKLSQVRSYNGGRLKTNPANVLPKLDNGTYFSGENRASQTNFFVVVQSLFVRNHNFIADQLANINPHWSEEQLFQEARKINIAIYQRIVYKEWLPLLLGTEQATRLDNVVYNIEADATTLNEFANAAFRIFHSFIPSEFELRDRYLKLRKISTSDAINEEENVASFENILRGLIFQNMSTSGYSTEILNKLFKNDKEVGLDLLSIDILRGRDHGIASYGRYRRHCNLKPDEFKIFNDLAPQISKDSITLLRQTYKTVYDIDLIVGAALEDIDENSSSIVGPTLGCIMLEQFYRWKAGDYYFYSHEMNFSKEQLLAIESYTMANFLCQNSDLASIQAEAFFNNGADFNCSEMPRIDLQAWKEDISSNYQYGVDENDSFKWQIINKL